MCIKSTKLQFELSKFYTFTPCLLEFYGTIQVDIVSIGFCFCSMINELKTG